MAYFEGFIVPVPRANREEYRRQATEAAPLFHDLGVLRHVEAWGSDVPPGKITDFRMAVAAKDDEDVVFSWFEYPSRDARDRVNQRIMTDPRMKQLNQVMPFDAQRMVFGGFDGFVEEGAARGSFIEGSITPVPFEKLDAYRDRARRVADLLRDLGALRSVEAIADDVRKGEVADFYRAVQAKPDETFFFSFVEWPDRQTRDDAWMTIIEEGELEHVGESPFDGERKIRGSFEPVLDSVWTSVATEDAVPHA